MPVMQSKDTDSEQGASVKLLNSFYTALMGDASALAIWLLYVVLSLAHIAPPRYFSAGPSQSWYIGALSMWMVLLSLPNLIRMLRQSNALHVAVIEATADGILVINSKGRVETYNQRCRDAGMDDYLCKPLRPDELGLMLSKWLPNRQ